MEYQAEYAEYHKAAQSDVNSAYSPATATATILNVITRAARCPSHWQNLDE